MDFKKYGPTQNVESGDSVYTDVVNHCIAYREYLVAGSRSSSAHEITHRCNSDLRNGAISLIIRDDVKSYCDNGIWTPSFPQPLIKGGDNAFYLLKDRAIRIAEPNCRKSDAVRLIPQSLRFSRFGLYVEGQRAWDDSPLYIYDEWVAYRNGAACSVEEPEKDKGTDALFGQIEFIAYGIGIMMAADKANSLSDLLKDFSKWLIIQCTNSYFKYKSVLPWTDMDKCYQQLKGNADFMSFMKSKLGMDLPEKEVPDDNPTPDIDFWI